MTDKTSTIRTCATDGCENVVEGHGNRKHCAECLTVTCAGCGKTFTLKHPSYKRARNFCEKACERNEELRSYVRDHMDAESASTIAEHFGISRQRVSQVAKEERAARDALARE